MAGILAFGTKENTAVLPITVLLYEFLFLQDGPALGRRKRILWGAGFAFVIPLALAVIFLGTSVFHDIWIEVLKGYPERDFTPYERVLTEFRVVLYYVTLLLYPAHHRLSLDHDFAVSHSLLNPPTTLFAGLFVVFLIGLAFALARRSPLVSFCIFWYFLNLAIESSIFNLELLFEHRLYLPSMSFFFLVSLGMVRILSRMQPAQKRIAAASLLCLFIVLQGNGTYVRNFVWQSDYSLWNDCLTKAPAKPRALDNLGHVYYQFGLYDKAEQYLLASLQTRPNHEIALNTLGAVYLETKRYDKALAAFKQAEKARPKWPMPITNQGVVYFRKGQYDEAERQYLRSLSTSGTTFACYQLGLTYLVQNKFSEAINRFATVLRIQPLDANALFLTAVAYRGLRRYQEALHFFGRVLAIDPRHRDTLRGRAVTWADLGDSRAMVSALEDLLRAYPFDYAGNLLMGKAQLAKKGYRRAKVCLRIAASVEPRAAEPYQHLSALYKELGDTHLANYYGKRYEETVRGGTPGARSPASTETSSARHVPA